MFGNNEDNGLLIGHDNNDRLYGLGGSDTLKGLGGDDRLEGGRGNDALFGGTGSDAYHFREGDGHDTVFDDDGGEITLDGLTLSGDAVLVDDPAALGFTTDAAWTLAGSGALVYLYARGGDIVHPDSDLVYVAA